MQILASNVWLSGKDKITWVQSHIVGLLLSKGYRSCELYSPSQTSNRIQHSGCDGDVDTEHHGSV